MFGLGFYVCVFLFKIMKHTEQLQPRSPANYARSGTLNVVDKTEKKENGGRKCCGGGDSGNSKS